MGHTPGWGSSPRHPIVKLLARLVVDGYGHAGVRVEGELHVVVHLGFADFFPWGLHLLRAPGEHGGFGRWAPLGEGSGCPRTVPPAETAPPVRGSPWHRWPQKGLPPPSGETEACQEGLACPRSSLHAWEALQADFSHNPESPGPAAIPSLRPTKPLEGGGGRKSKALQRQH